MFLILSYISSFYLELRMKPCASCREALNTSCISTLRFSVVTAQHPALVL